MSNPFFQQVSRDIESVFLNPNELGKCISWNGYPLLATEDVGYRIETQRSHGVDKEVMRLVCAADALSPLPKSYELVVIDDADWMITSVSKSGGFLIISLESSK